LSPFIILYIRKRIRDNLEDPKRYKERFGIPSRERPHGDLIWVHAVSVGETLSIIPFLNVVRSIHENVTILFTTTTLTARDAVNKRLGDKVIHQFMPFDVYFWVKKFVQYWKPKVVFFVESEIWPNALFYLNKEAIPVYLLNARISQKTLGRMLTLKKYFNVMPYRPFKEVFVPSAEVGRYVGSLGAFNVTVLPNMKMISDKLPCTIDNALTTKTMLNKRKTWFAVSTHKGEEEIVIDIHKELKNKYSDLLTVIAVRHTDRVPEVIDICSVEGLSYSLYSDVFENGEPIETDIYIIDEMGVLGMLFENIGTVFVGGSLIKGTGIGGHNIVEPIKFSCNVVTGLYTDNFRDLYDYLQASWTKVQGKPELLEFVSNSIANYSKESGRLDMAQYKTQWTKTVTRISREVFPHLGSNSRRKFMYSQV
jgi:3-deoxy-D-manno-octulosonic-acid transferase